MGSVTRRGIGPSNQTRLTPDSTTSGKSISTANPSKKSSSTANPSSMETSATDERRFRHEEHGEDRVDYEVETEEPEQQAGADDSKKEATRREATR